MNPDVTLQLSHRDSERAVVLEAGLAFRFCVTLLNVQLRWSFFPSVYCPSCVPSAAWLVATMSFVPQTVNQPASDLSHFSAPLRSEIE